jgi:hypothetical protein
VIGGALLTDHNLFGRIRRAVADWGSFQNGRSWFPPSVLVFYSRLVERSPKNSSKCLTRNELSDSSKL